MVSLSDDAAKTHRFREEFGHLWDDDVVEMVTEAVELLNRSVEWELWTEGADQCDQSGPLVDLIHSFTAYKDCYLRAPDGSIFRQGQRRAV